jgi:hypothetical protein
VRKAIPGSDRLSRLEMLLEKEPPLAWFDAGRRFGGRHLAKHSHHAPACWLSGLMVMAADHGPSVVENEV